MWYIFLAAMTVFNVVADILAKEWSVRPRVLTLVASFAAYSLAAAAWFLCLRSGSGLARGISIVAVTTAIIAVLVGVFFYKEEVSMPQAAGMVLGGLSLILIFWPDIS
jgi:drug/metabolite transporter (DMT)-like permease